MIKYSFKSFSEDPRPIKDIGEGMWFVTGVSYDDGSRKRYWEIVLYVNDGAVYDYYPEAKEVHSEKEAKPKVSRGSNLSIIPYLRHSNLEEHIKWVNGEYNPRFIYTIKSLARRGVSVTEIAKRMGLNGNRFRWMLKKDEIIRRAYNEGYEQFLEDALK